jgi:D-alanine-D-alanine ligase
MPGSKDVVKNAPKSSTFVFPQAKLNKVPTMGDRDVRVAVMCGGDSPEREVSLRSGQGVHAALIRRGWDADLITIDTYDGLPNRLAPYAAVFNILHGGAGEDGTVQLLLDILGKPYVGSGPVASALGMDKAEARRIFQAKGIPVPSWLLFSGGDLEAFLLECAALGFPLVLKPRREGSSVGLHFACDESSLRRAVAELSETFGELLVERFIPGRELTVAVLDDDAPVVLPLVELRPKGGLFDWTAKYTPGECEFVCPAELCREDTERVGAVARAAHLALGCRDFSRVDIRLSPDGTPYERAWGQTFIFDSPPRWHVSQ